jgi:pyrrolidone-carboxylate peptidase
MIVLAPFLFALAAHARSPEVVVTAFGPFGSYRTNPAIPIGRTLVKHLAENGIKARFCEIPVTFGGSLDGALRCIEGPERGRTKGPRDAPKLIFALGAGASCTRANLETKAENWIDGDEPDAAGVYVDGAIESHGPDFVKLPYEATTLLSALSSSEREWLNLSDDMGRFVCNDFAYETSRFIANSRRYARTQFAFLHVPAQDCPESLQDAELWSPLATKMILAALGKRAKTPLVVHFDPPSPKPISFELPKVDLRMPKLDPPPIPEPKIPPPIRRSGRD